MPIKKYNATFPDIFNAFTIELYCWREYDKLRSPLERWEHLRNACVMGVPGMRDNYHPWFERMCQAYAYNSYIAAMGCSSSTKTWTFHTLGFLDYMSDPLNTQLICTTTSVEGLKTRMWPIIAALYGHFKPAGWKIQTAPTMRIFSNKMDPKHTIRAVAIRKAADQTEITDNIIGAHTDRVIWIVDEATSAPRAIFPAWSNLKGATSHRRFCLLGNSEDQLDSLGSFCRPKTGWDSVNEETGEWRFDFEGEQGLAIHLDGLKSPNLAIKAKVRPNGELVSRWPFMFGHQDANHWETAKERDPLSYWRFCRGWYADASLVPKVMTMAEIDHHRCRSTDTVFYGATENFISIDPAFGGDRPHLKVWKMGVDVESQRQVMQQIKEVDIPLQKDSRKGEAIGKFCMEVAKEFKAVLIAMDTTTDNSAPAEYIELNSDYEVLWVDFGGSPSDDPVSPTDKTLCKDKYDRKVTELWFTVKHLLPQIRGLDEETCVELCTRYFFRKGRPEKLSVETKTEMKKRASGKSPDRADSTALGCAAFRHLGGFDLPIPREKSTGWIKMAKKRNAIYSQEHSYT